MAVTGQIFEQPRQNSTQLSGLATFGAESAFSYTPCVQKSAHVLQLMHRLASTTGYQFFAMKSSCKPFYLYYA
jgi:hypothetical protein